MNNFQKWPYYTEEEIEAVSNILRSGKVNYWTGNEGRIFEKDFAAFTGCQYAIALANGTVALDLALRALNIGPGDEVITTPRTFIATASCIVNVGAIPIFADVDLNSQNITADSISKVITNKTKAIIVVHLAGFPAEMDPIMELASDKNLFVIEDCAQAHGARYKGRSVGSIGHIGAWSFCQDKIISTGGEGGMVTTNSKIFWHKMWSYKDHGKSYSSVYNKCHQPGFKWLHESFGTNYRMTEMQAAIGRLQLKRIDETLRIRKANIRELRRILSDYNFLLWPKVPKYSNHAYYKLYGFINSQKVEKIEGTRDHLISEFNSMGLKCSQGICPEVYKEKSLQDYLGKLYSNASNVRILGRSSICFEIFPDIM